MKWLCSLLVLSGLLMSRQVLAFYSWQDDDTQGDARLLLRAFAIASQAPDTSTTQNDSQNEAAGGLARFILQSNHSNHLSYEFNAYQTYIDQSLVKQQGSLSNSLDVERSASLEWSFSDSEYAHLAIDRMNVRWSGDSYNFTLGRQTINLATTFFFSPNDFFAPFAAQSFYRVYKPGVDGLRAEFATGELSRISVIGVLGYSAEANSDFGWSDDPDSDRASWLAAYQFNLAGFEWGLLAGKVRRTRVEGASISGELFAWLGIRIEGHRAEDLDRQHAEYSDYSIGLEHRWENSLQLQFEQYYHGVGAPQVQAYNLQQAYPARRYQAIGLSYEISPLWTGQASLIYNQIDASRLYSLNLVHSVSDESEMSIDLSLPTGEAPLGNTIRSEYGAYPRLLNLEFRVYF